MSTDFERVMKNIELNQTINILPVKLWESEKAMSIGKEESTDLKTKRRPIFEITRFAGKKYIFKYKQIIGVSGECTTDREDGDYYNIWLHCLDGTILNFSGDEAEKKYIEFLPLSVFLEKIKPLLPEPLALLEPPVLPEPLAQPGVCKHKFISMEKTIFCENCGRSAL